MRRRRGPSRSSGSPPTTTTPARRSTGPWPPSAVSSTVCSSRAHERARGLPARVRRVEGAPVGAVRLGVRAGARVEPVPGQSLLTGRMLSEGTRTRDWLRIADEAEGKGMVLSSYGTFECHAVAVDALARDWELALEWAAELLLTPSFPEDR